MENNTDSNDIQQSYLKLTDLGQNTHFPHIDFPSLPNLETLQDLISYPTDTYQPIFNSTFSGGVSFSEQRVNQQDVTYSLSSELLLRLPLSSARGFAAISLSLLMAVEQSEGCGMKRSSSCTINFCKDSHLNQCPSNNNWSDQGHVNYMPIENDDLFSYLDNSQDYSVGEQSTFSTYPGYNMATTAPPIAAPLESGNTVSNRPKLQYSVPECSQDRKFPSESALRKHEAKHTKPYICPVPNCKHTRFGDKGGLDRHSREVHGSQTHCCPITSCKRHVRGFPRKYNLFEHQKRCHNFQPLKLAPPSILRQQNDTSDGMKGQQESYEGGSSPETVAGGRGRLREKLEDLYKTRAEIEVDIEALKRCLDLLGEDSP